MTTTLVLNLLAAIAIVTALVGVCRLAFNVAGGLLDSHQVTFEPETRPEAERLAA
jgi:hypothetical protein